MGILTNPRHELFAQELAKGKSASEAYTVAGYRPCRQNAARLMSNDDIRTRLAELQATAAKSTAITVESICRQLDEANAVAKQRGQASAMVSASALRAKLAGLMIEKVEVGNPGSFDSCETVADVADSMLTRLVDSFRPVDAKDRQGLIKLLERHSNEMQDYLAAISARPIIAQRFNPGKTPWQQLELHPSAKIDNPAELRYREGKERRRLQLQRPASNGHRH
jgi:hypothetical protein